VITWSVTYLDTVDSTNDEAWARFETGAPEGTVVAARVQTKGRGRRGRTWRSRSGEGLWCSILLRPHMQAANLGNLTAAASVALTDVLQKDFNLDARIKWPNDIVIADRKIAGVLLESRISDEKANSAVLGIGLNTNADPDAWNCDFEVPPTSLSMETDKQVDHQCLLEKQLLPCMAERLEMTAAALEEIWVSRSSLIGRAVEVKSAKGDAQGVCVGLSLSCGLEIRTDNGKILTFQASDVSVRLK